MRRPVGCWSHNSFVGDDDGPFVVDDGPFVVEAVCVASHLLARDLRLIVPTAQASYLHEKERITGTAPQARQKKWLPESVRIAQRTAESPPPPLSNQQEDNRETNTAARASRVTLALGLLNFSAQRHATQCSATPHLINCSNLRRQASVHAEHLVVHQGRQVKVVEDIDAVLPRVRVAVLAHALLVKPVHLTRPKRSIPCRLYAIYCSETQDPLGPRARISDVHVESNGMALTGGATRFDFSATKRLLADST